MDTGVGDWYWFCMARPCIGLLGAYQGLERGHVLPVKKQTHTPL